MNKEKLYKYISARKMLNIVMSIVLILSACNSFPGREVNAAGGDDGGGYISAYEDDDGMCLELSKEGSGEITFELTNTKDSPTYTVVCNQPMDSDNESIELPQIGSVLLNGVTLYFAMLENGSMAMEKIDDHIEVYGESGKAVINPNVEVITNFIYGEGSLNINGTLWLLSDFIRSESCSVIVNQGTIRADSIKIDDDSGFTNSGTLKAAVSFEKGDFNLGGTVVAESDTDIISEGGTFTLQVGSKKKSFSGYIEGKAGDLIQKSITINLSGVSDIWLGENRNLSENVTLSDSGYDGEVHIEYKKDTDSDYSTQEPTSIGAWLVRARAEETDNYKEAVTTEYPFNVSYLPLDHCKEVEGGKYLTIDGISNGKYARESITLTPDPDFLVKGNWGDSEFGSSIEVTKDDLYPEFNGGNFYESRGFYLKIKEGKTNEGAETDQYPYYTMVDGLKNVIFDEEPPEFESFSIDGVSGEIYDEDEVRAKNVKIVVSDDNLESVFTEEKTYSRDNGEVTAVGSKYKATVELDAVLGNPQEIAIGALDMSGNETSLYFILKYPLITPTASVSVEDIYYGTEISPVVTTNSDGKSDVTYRYKKTTESDFLPEVPTEVGTYDIQATIPETDTYEAIDVTATFKIMKKTPEVADIKVPDTQVGQDYEPVLTTDSDGKEEAKIEYKKDGEDDDKYSETKPTAAGKYVVRATIPATKNYESIQCTSTFKILKKEKVTAKVEVADTVIGTDYEPVLTTDSDGKADAKFEYKKDGEDDDKYSETKPTAAGKYVIRATIPETDNYQKIVVTNTFTIKKKTPSTLKVSVSDTYVDQDYDPVLTTDSDGKDKAKFTYKGENDDKFSDDKPTRAGKYTVKAKVPETDTYEAGECTATFTIKRNPVEAKVSLGTILAGTSYEPKVNTASKGKVEFMYKASNEDDDKFTSDQPKTPGRYVVRAEIAETDKYEAVTCSTEYNIVYLAAPAEPYTLSGTQGNHDFFISDVYLKAAEGCALSTQFMGTYMKLLPYNENLGSVYLRRDSDGALTGPIEVSETVKIDKVAPAFEDVRSQLGDMSDLVNGKVIYANDIVIRATDENLSSVTVNGLKMTSDDKVHDIILDSDTDDGTAFYQLIAEDLAGNTNSVSFTLMQDWLKDGNIPLNRLIPLVVSKSYKLEGGRTYKMSGDPTIYYGGRPIYVRSSGKYRFSDGK